MGDLITEETAKALERLFGNSFAESSNYIADKIRFLRWKNAVKTLNRAREIVEKNGGVNNVPSLKFLIPFMEGASLEEDDSLVDLWAGLFASASRVSHPGHLYFKSILQEITAEHAEFLKKICRTDSNNRLEMPRLNKSFFKFKNYFDRESYIIIKNTSKEKIIEEILSKEDIGFLFTGVKFGICKSYIPNIERFEWEEYLNDYEKLEKFGVISQMESFGLIKSVPMTKFCAVSDSEFVQPTIVSEELRKVIDLDVVTITRVGFEFMRQCQGVDK